jgi:hypothetical protein
MISRFCNLESPLEQRIKIGEALCKVSRARGTAIPKYTPLLVNSFLFCISLRNYEGDFLNRRSKENLTEEELATFRASCLSNMGEIFENLRWGVSKYIQVSSFL